MTNIDLTYQKTGMPKIYNFLIFVYSNNVKILFFLVKHEVMLTPFLVQNCNKFFKHEE
jgi:hypothetical protein